jgi:hypothetical protein
MEKTWASSTNKLIAWAKFAIAVPPETTKSDLQKVKSFGKMMNRQ